MKKKEKFLFNIRLAAWIEIICFFLVCLGIATLAEINFNLFKLSPHPFWIIVLLMSAQYGTNAGLLAALISTVILLSGPLPKYGIMQEQSEYFFVLAKLPLLWFVSALILGELRMKHIRERDYLMDIASKTKEREHQLAESYEALKRVKERLELHVASQTPTSQMVIEAFTNLQKCKKEEIIPNACALIKVLIAPEKFSFYFIDHNSLNDQNQLTLIQGEGWTQEDRYIQTFTSSDPLFREIVEKKRTVALITNDFDVLGNEGIIAAPIEYFQKDHFDISESTPRTSKVIGMIKIELMPFQKLKYSTLESLRMIGLFIGEIYER